VTTQDLDMRDTVFAYYSIGLIAQTLSGNQYRLLSSAGGCNRDVLLAPLRLHNNARTNPNLLYCSRNGFVVVALVRLVDISTALKDMYGITIAYRYIRIDARYYSPVGTIDSGVRRICNNGVVIGYAVERT